MKISDFGPPFFELCTGLSKWDYVFCIWSYFTMTFTNDWIDTSHVLGSFWSSLGVGEEEEVVRSFYI